MRGISDVTWFRQHIKHGSRLALFALAVQFMLSWGHFHPLEIAHPASSPGLTQSVSLPGDTDDHDHAHHAAEFCAICAVMVQAASMLATASPVLPAREFASRMHAPSPAILLLAAAPRAAFQPRAPPLA